MKSALLALVLFVSFSLAAVTQENGVYVLDSANWESWMSEHDNVLVEFYAPWCGHCKRLTPEYEAAAQQLGSKANLVKVDATENEDLASQFGIRGFPTLFWFEKGTALPTPYTGGRTADTIASWIERQIMTDVSVLSSQSELDELLKNKPEGVYSVLVQFGGSINPDLLNLARTNEFVTVRRVDSSNIFGGAKEGDVVMYRSHADPLTTQVTSANELNAWVNNNAFPPVTEFSQPGLQRLQNSDYVFIAADSYSEGKRDSLVDILNQVAASRPSVGWMYADSEVLGRGITGAGASGDVWPTGVAINFKTNEQIPYNEELPFTVENVGKWIDGLYDGTSQPFKKSAPIPESNDAPVTILVYKNFDQIVSAKPAFVEYYAPWCGHCKSLAPIWDELGEAFRDAEVTIAKIDATANYVDAKIQGFPTLLWHQDGNTETYDGERTIEALTSFVRSKLGHSHSHEEL